MAVSGTIAEPKLVVTLTGWDKVWGQLKTLTTSAASLGKELNTIGSISLGAFAKAQGGILAFMRAANPVGVDILTTKIQVLLAVIGKTFNPVLESAIAWLDKMIAKFRNMTDEQRENILHWTKIVMTVLAVGAAIGTLIPIITQVISVARAIGAIVSLFGGWVSIALLVAGIIASIAMGGEGLPSIFKPLVDVFKTILHALEPIWDAFEKIWEGMKPIFEKWVAAIGKIVQALMPLIELYGELYGAVLEAAEPFLEMFGDAAVSVLEVVADVIKDIVDIIMDMIENFKDFNDWLADSWIGEQIGMEGFDRSGGEREARGAGDFSKDKGSGGSWDENGNEVDDSGNRFASRAPIGKPQFQAVADVYKKVQESAVQDPKQELLKQQLDNAKTQTNLQKRIADNTGKDSPATYSASGDWGGGSNDF